MRIRQCSRVLGITAAVLASLSLFVPTADAPAAGGSQPKPQPGSPSGSADEIVAGVGSTDGYRVFVARSTGGWSWQPVALLDPGGESDQAWVGNTCLTGDGSAAVSGIAPWSPVNSPAGNERGGIADFSKPPTRQSQGQATSVSVGELNPRPRAPDQPGFLRYH